MGLTNERLRGMRVVFQVATLALLAVMTVNNWAASAPKRQAKVQAINDGPDTILPVAGVQVWMRATSTKGSVLTTLTLDGVISPCRLKFTT